ncbi:MAG: trigger factor [Methylococcales bacterium]
MEVSVETTSELNRKLTVHVPEDTVKEKVDSKLQSLSKDIKIDGFRPGKVPPGVIRKRFGGAVRSEVIGELIQSSLGEAVEKEDLQIAGGLEVESTDAEEGQGLRFVASFEVYPQIELKPPKDLTIKGFASEVAEGDVDNMIERLREQRKDWKNVDRAAQTDDQLTINFEGSIADEVFTEGLVEDFMVVLGSNQMIPGFEDKLIGAETGQHLQFEIEFPAEYQNEKLAGKLAEFDVDVVQVEEGHLPEIDEEFIISYGVESGDQDAFREDIKNNMQRELQRGLQAKNKTEVMDALYAAHPLVLPKVMVEQEIDRIIAPIKESFQKQNKALPEDLPRDDYRQQAERRVGLGLLFVEILKKNQIQVDKDRVRSTIEGMAESYEDPQQMIDWYYSNPDQLNQIEQMVLEDQLVDWVLEQAKVTNESISFDELTNPSQETDKERG